ncbi:MAG: hypothetical protein J6Q65_02845, partial [Lentisphaeria bacterium]|nr:hypothetical protein [Lentisphaeria bacterium]
LLLSGGKIVFNGSTDEFTTQEQQVRCVAITVPGGSLFRTAELLREKFPGSSRLDGDRIIVPEDLAEDPAFRSLLEAEGLATGEQTPYPATLDDVFAFLTRRAPEKPVPAETEEQTADPVENQEEDDDE